MRVLQAIAGARHGGAEAFFARLVPALARAGVAQHVVMRPDPERRAALLDAGIAPVEAPFGGWFDLVTRRRLAAETRTFRPDVLLTWMNRATGFARPGPYRLVARLGGYYDPKWYRRCDHLVANTPDIRAWLIGQGFAEGRVHYLPNFVDAVAAAPIDRSSLQTPGDAPLLLCLGRLHANKGFDVALEALARLPSAWLWIAGEGPERAGLQAQAERLGIAGRVRWLGWRSDAPALLAAADLLVCPSRHEPLGNVVIEGWAHRRPVVAAASAGPAQLIRDGQDGLLVPIDDSRALAERIAGLLAAPALRDALAVAARARYEAEYTEAAVVARYLDFFAEIAG